MDVCNGSSLHQMLHDTLRTFDLIRFGEEGWAFLLVGYAVFMIFFTRWMSWKANRKWSAPTWLIVLAVGAIVVQIPNLAIGYLHIDESQHIGEGIKLASDPRMWVSVDGTSVGPISLLPATAIIWLGGDLDYATVRILNLLLWSAIACFTFASFATFLDRKRAFWYTLPLFAVFPFMHNPDYVSYNGETAAALMLSIAIWLIIGAIVKGPKNWRLASLGIVLALAPLSKVQIGPVALVLGIAALYFLKGQYKKQMLLIGGVTIAVAVLFIFLLLTGTVGDFFEVYIINNLSYASSSIGLNYDKSFGTRILRLPMTLFELIETRHVLLAAFVIVAAFVVMRWRERRDFWQHISVPGLGVIVMSMVLLVIWLPGHKYYHYVILVIPSAVLVSGILFDRLFAKYEFRFAVFTVCVVLPQAFMSAFQPKDTFTKLVNGSLGGGNMEITRKLCELGQEGQKIAQWGYDTYIYSETQLMMGTRDAQTHRHIHTIDQQEYYVKRFVGDMIREEPEFFIDTTMKNSFLFDFTRHNYSNYPSIERYVHENYSRVGELHGAIIFVRNNLTRSHDQN